MKDLASKTKVLIALAVVGVSLATYLGLCTMAQGSSSILSDVTIGGVAVGGMSKAEAIEAVTSNLSSNLESNAITLSSSTWNGILEGGVTPAEIETAVDAAYNLGRESFISSGYHFLTGKTSDSDIEVTLTLSEEGMSQFHSLLDEADASMAGAVVQSEWVVDYENQTLTITKGSTGTAINRAAAEEATLQAIASRTVGNVTLSTDSTSPTPLNFDEIRDAVYVEPVNAQLDPSTMEVGPHTNGLDLNTSTATARYSTAAEGETFTVELIVTAPEQTTDYLRSTLFSDILGEGTSVVSSPASRQANVANAQSKMDRILLPGEVYSFYEQCGPWTTGNGYGYGSAYVNGGTSSVLAGGVCQGSSTLYYAILHTELEVVERKRHTYVVEYLPRAMDATVYSNTIDFKFKNNTDYPIKVVAETRYSGGVQYLDVKIYGTKTNDNTIVPVSTVYNYVAPSYAGGYTGCTATLVRYHYDAAGNLIKEEPMYTETYAASGGGSYTYNVSGDSSSSSSTTTPETVPEDVPTEENVETPDTTTPDTSVPDTVVPDTVVPDTVVPDTVVPDAVVPDTVVPEPTPAPETTPAPEPTPAPETTPAPTPEPTPAPTPEPTPAPTPAPEATDAVIPGM